MASSDSGSRGRHKREGSASGSESSSSSDSESVSTSSASERSNGGRGRRTRSPPRSRSRSPAKRNNDAAQQGTAAGPSTAAAAQPSTRDKKWEPPLVADRDGADQGRDLGRSRGTERDREELGRSGARDRDYDRRERDRDRDRDVRADSPDRRGRYSDGRGFQRDRDREYDRRDRDRDRGNHRDGGRDRDGRRDRDSDRSGVHRTGRDDSRDRRGRDEPETRKRQREADAPAAGGDGNGAAAGAEVAAVERKPVNPGKTGGVYIPPFKLARMMQEVEDRSSAEYQRLTWEALKKSLNGIVNKVNTSNIKSMLPEVFRENLDRGRGLFCRSIMKSQMASPSFSAVYAALVAVINSKLHFLGQLLLNRLVLQFKRSYKRNDKPVCAAAVKFIAQLINQGVASDLLALQILLLLLDRPSEDSVELAVDFTKEVGQHLQDQTPAGLNSVFEGFRAVLHNGAIGKRVQFIVEGLFAIRKAGFAASGFPSVRPELDMLDDEDRIVHDIGLEPEEGQDPLNAQVSLDVFRALPPEEYESDERRWSATSKAILGEEEESDEEEEGGDEDDEDDEEEEDEEAQAAAQAQQDIEDATKTNLVNLRRTIYLTLMSSMDFEEAGHKLTKIKIEPGQEIELVTMILECCSQERTYKRFFGLLAQRFCEIDRTHRLLYEDCFRKQYSIIHRLETNKLRNVSCFFAHLLATGAISWEVLQCIHLTEDDTTSSSRIFIKYLFQELSSTLGLIKLNQRLNDPMCDGWFDGIFPKDSLANMRFSINFFTSIGLGGVTDRMREMYKQTVALQAQQQAKALAAERERDQDSGSSGSTTSSSSSDDSSSSSGTSSSDSDTSSSSSSGSDSD